MTNTEPIDLDAIEARAAAASVGPWSAMSPRPDGRKAVERPDYDPFKDEVSKYLLLFDTNPDDAEFIAHAREDVPALIAEVRRLREREERAWKSDDFEIVNGWLVERGVLPLDYPAGAAYGSMPYSDAEPLLDLKKIAGWPQQPDEETR